LATVSRGHRAGESARSTGGSLPSRHRERHLACPRQQYLRRAVHRRSGGSAIRLAVSTLPATLLFTAFCRFSSCSSRRRLLRHRRAFHSAPFAFFARTMALQFIAEFFLMPETRGAAPERRSGTGTNARAPFACPGENPRAAICDATNRSSPCRTIKDKENI
jgi:hypothetical protein